MKILQKPFKFNPIQISNFWIYRGTTDKVTSCFRATDKQPQSAAKSMTGGC